MNTTILEYLYDMYECDNMELLIVRCPINLNKIDLNAEVTIEFKEYLNQLENEENKVIHEIYNDRNKTDDGVRYSFEEVLKSLKNN